MGILVFAGLLPGTGLSTSKHTCCTVSKACHTQADTYFSHA